MVEARLKELTDAKAQLVANANALNGAIQECQRLIEHLEKTK